MIRRQQHGRRPALKRVVAGTLLGLLMLAPTGSVAAAAPADTGSHAPVYEVDSGSWSAPRPNSGSWSSPRPARSGSWS